MENFMKNVACNFNLSLLGASREKFGVLGVLDKGFVMFQKYQDTAENIGQILFVNDVKRHLIDNNFGFVANFLVTNSGEPYCKHGGDVFTAVLLKDVEKSVFTINDIFLDIVKHLARMHKTLHNIQLEAKPKKRHAAPPPEKAAHALATFKKKLMKAGKFSEFDMMFLKVHEIFATHIESWATLPKEAFEGGEYICHNLLKEENIYIGDAPIFVNFSCAGYGHYFDDLAYIIRRYLKQAPATPLRLDEVLAAYLQYNPDKNFDIASFKAKLLYPDKFIKLSKDYYSKNRNFAPKTYLTRIEECYVRGKAMIEFID